MAGAGRRCLRPQAYMKEQPKDCFGRILQIQTSSFIVANSGACISLVCGNAPHISHLQIEAHSDHVDHTVGWLQRRCRDEQM